MTRRTPRAWTFGLFCLCCILLTAVSVIRTMRRAAPLSESGAPRQAAPLSLSTRPWPSTGPTVLFSSLVPGDGVQHRLAIARPGLPEGPRWLTRLACERLYFAGGRGICLGDGGGTASLPDDVIATHAYVFGSDLQILHDIRLGGFPSRVRVAPDGRHGAVTVFVAGHSYSDAAFSTETTVLDLESGARIANLESFAVTRNGRPFRSVDFNFWGVTFAADSDRFYATLATGTRTYLVEGSVRTRRMETRRENVECPSISPGR